jgi:hypothetical protein
VSDSFGTDSPIGQPEQSGQPTPDPFTGQAPAGGEALDSHPADAGTAPSPPIDPAAEPAAVWPPLAELVHSGVITVAQAAAVHDTLVTPDPEPAKPKRPRLLADAALYLGGALVLIAIYVFIGSGAGSWSKSTLFAAISGFALVLALIGVAIVVLSEASWKSLREPGNDATRRLVSVLLTLAVTTFCGGLATLPNVQVACFVGFCEQGGSRGSQVLPFLAIAVLEFALLFAVRLLAPTPFSEFFWFESFVLIAIVISIGWLTSTAMVAALIGASGAIWIALCLTTRLIRTRDLGLALGTLVVVLASAGYEIVGSGGWILLGIVIAAFVVLYLFSAKWQFLTGAALATLIATLRYISTHFDQSPTSVALAVGITGAVLALFGLLGYMVIRRRTVAANI